MYIKIYCTLYLVILGMRWYENDMFVIVIHDIILIIIKIFRKLLNKKLELHLKHTGMTLLVFFRRLMFLLHNTQETTIPVHTVFKKKKIYLFYLDPQYDLLLSPKDFDFKKLGCA